MRWALNNEIEDLSKKVNNLLKEEKYGVRQNIKTFLTGVEKCTSSDVAKSESYLHNTNSALNTAYDIPASIDSKRKEHFQSADYSQGRSKPWKTWGRGITELEGASILRGEGGRGAMLPRKILKISLSENVFTGF